MAITIYSYLTILVLLALLVACILLIATLFIRYRQTQVTATLFLLVAIQILFIANLIELILAVINFENIALNYSSSTVVKTPKIFNLLGILTAGMFLLFIDYFENEQVSASRLTIYSSLSVAHIIYSGIFYSLDPQSIKLDPTFGSIAAILNVLFLLSLPVFLIYVTISCFRSIAEVKKFALDTTQTRQLTELSLTIIFFYIVTFVFNITASLLNNALGALNDDFILIISSILPRISLILGVLVLWHAYAMSTRTAFLQPQQMQKLLVITRTGLPIFSYDFIEEEGVDSILLSGGLTAIKALLKEAVGTTSEITAMKFKEKEIMVWSSEKFGVFLIVERTSNFLRNAIIAFGKEFETNFPIDESDFIDENSFEGANPIVRKIFGLEEA